MKNRSTIIAISAIIIFGIIIFLVGNSSSKPINNPGPAGSVALAFDSSVSDGTIIVSYPSDKYGLATKPDQILARSYIPPCDQNFIYCLYATSTAYEGTNFESAGIRIEKRTDLTSERACLNTPPEGYDVNTLPNVSTSSDKYSSSGFLSRSDAGAGHYASGSLFRLFYTKTHSCYEFETRLGATQFMNYPAGTIKEFTPTDRDEVNFLLSEMLSRVTLQSGQSNLFSF